MHAWDDIENAPYWALYRDGDEREAGEVPWGQPFVLLSDGQVFRRSIEGQGDVILAERIDGVNVTVPNQEPVVVDDRLTPDR